MTAPAGKWTVAVSIAIGSVMAAIDTSTNAIAKWIAGVQEQQVVIVVGDERLSTNDGSMELRAIAMRHEKICLSVGKLLSC